MTRKWPSNDDMAAEYCSIRTKLRAPVSSKTLQKPCGTMNAFRGFCDADREQLRNANRAPGRRQARHAVQPAGSAAERVSRNHSAPVLDEGPAREPAAARRWAVCQGVRRRDAGALGPEERRADGDLVRAGASPDAGLHRRAGR